ncbi:3-hydroxyisobutyryl-CoA hydrolase-like protein 1, mitochondrial isoform X1 [Apium graveolens]|uniref:3-hydroxyisobutyryl-CoA hydrolase-like protein 1, mitochondrial isoform X1 n=1 Tax=Apium graveolens TaxID=4045 RepID=UPI003D7A7ACC
MASSVSAFLRRRCRMSRGSLGMIQSFTRSLNSQTKAAAAVLDDPALNYVIVQGSGNSRTAVLNRPSTLNALNTSMGDRLQKLYEGWENDPNVGFVALKGSGRAFCAGGDIVGLWQLINKGVCYTGNVDWFSS